jgi:uncharacterized protein with FMN-binding domain
MRRAILVTAGTAAGLAAVLTYTPRPAQSADLVVAEPAPTPSASASADSTAPAAPVAQTYTGPLVQTAFGPVQVSVTVEAGKITAADALQTPSADPKSLKIAKTAIPLLQQETLAAQSAEVAVVTGASYTSDGWKQSLAGAIRMIPADAA